MLTRRDLLATGSLAMGAPPPRPMLATQSYVWTQILDREKRGLAGGVREMTAACRRAGYKRIELMSRFLDQPALENTADALRRERLRVPGIYADGPMHEAELAEKTIASVLQYAGIARKFGAGYVTTNPHPKPGRAAKTDAELAVQAQYVEQLTGALAGRGMRLFLHHHDAEMREGAHEWRHLLDNTSCELCIDVDWVIQGGQQPRELIRKAGRRLASLHVRNARNKIWTESLDEGDYDYAPIASELKKTRFAGCIIIELALRPSTTLTRSLEDNLRRSREWAEKMFGPLV